MTNQSYRSIIRFVWAKSKAQSVKLALVLACFVSFACAQDQETVSLTAVTYNYGEAYSMLRINGEWAGAGSDSVAPGDFTGGGRLCCIDLPVGAKTATVEVQLAAEKYVTQAKIEQPWPSGHHYAVVHLMPGRKVVISITASSPAPRIDLLNEALKSVGIVDYTIQAPYLWDSGPEQRI